MEVLFLAITSIGLVGVLAWVLFSALCFLGVAVGTMCKCVHDDLKKNLR